MARLKIAFVGSGGGARGLAHLGVLRACEELGLAPEIFVGANAGALVAATYGQGVPLDVLLDAYRLPWRRRHAGPRLHTTTFLGAPSLRDLFDPGYLASGVFSLDGLERYLAKQLPIDDFRRLPNTVLVTAVDIDSGRSVVFGPGHSDAVPVSRAVAASCALPGLFRPVRVGTRHCVSGEIARTLSADLAVAAGADVVILSNVYRPEERKPTDRSLARSGILAVLRQSLNVLHSEKERHAIDALSRLYPRVTFIEIAPDVGHTSYVNRWNARPLVLRGYGTGLRVLAGAKERGVFDGSVSANARLN